MLRGSKPKDLSYPWSSLAGLSALLRAKAYVENHLDHVFLFLFLRSHMQYGTGIQAIKQYETRLKTQIIINPQTILISVNFITFFQDFLGSHPRVDLIFNLYSFKMIKTCAQICSQIWLQYVVHAVTLHTILMLETCAHHHSTLNSCLQMWYSCLVHLLSTVYVSSAFKWLK